MLFNLFKKKTVEKEPEKPVETKPIEPVKPAAPKRVWIPKRVKVENAQRLLKDLMEDIILTPNSDYELKKKELIEDFEGETVWEYSPTSFPFELLDDGSVIIEDAYKKKVTIGKTGLNNVKAIRKSIQEGRKPDVTLLGGKYKKVYDDDVVKGETDWSVVIEYEVLKK